jgi:hypothetical protein
LIEKQLVGTKVDYLTIPTLVSKFSKESAGLLDMDAELKFGLIMMHPLANNLEGGNNINEVVSNF